jgi:putative aldouronate transport system substrate-binding protein
LNRFRFFTVIVFSNILLALALSSCQGKKGLVKAVPLENGRYAEILSISLGRYVQPDPRFPKGDSYTDNAYTRYIKERLNTVFTDEFEASGDDFERQAALSIASGEIPDIMTIRNIDMLNELVKAGLIADLTGAFESYASPRLRELYDTYGGRCLDKAIYDGRLMALPGTRADDQPFMFWIREDWLERLGLRLDPDGDRCISLAELEHTARTFIEKKAGGEGTLGLAFSPGLWDELIAMEAAFGAGPNRWLRDEEGKLYHGSISDETRRILEQLRTWFGQGILDPQFGTRGWDDISALLISGKLGIVPGQWHIPDWRLSSVKKMIPGAMFNAYTLTGPLGKAHVTHSNAAERFVVVRKGFSNPEAAVLLANILFDELKRIEPDKVPEITAYVSAGVDNSARPLWLEIEPANGDLEEYAQLKELTEGQIPLSKIEKLDRRIIGQGILNYLRNPAAAEINEWAYYTSRMRGVGLMYETGAAGLLDWKTPVFPATTETMKQKFVNLQTMQEEYFVKIITGREPLSAFDVFVTRWFAEGGKAIVEEIEKAR